MRFRTAKIEGEGTFTGMSVELGVADFFWPLGRLNMIV